MSKSALEYPYTSRLGESYGCFRGSYVNGEPSETYAFCRLANVRFFQRGQR